MRMELLYPSKYLAVSDLVGLPNNEGTFTIRQIYQEEMEGKGGKKELKVLVKLDETPKVFVLNRTNAKTVAKLYGPETDAWIGQRISIYPTEVEAFGETVMALRVRLSVLGGFGGKLTGALNQLVPPAQAPQFQLAAAFQPQYQQTQQFQPQYQQPYPTQAAPQSSTAQPLPAPAAVPVAAQA